MNPTIQLLKSHRCFQDFDENYQLTQDELTAILEATCQAPSWMNGQMYSIIVIKERTIRQKLVELNPGNPQILKSSLFLLLVADLKRTQEIAKQYHADYRISDSLNALIIATTDTSLALQNAIIASESLGLGTVPVGSLRNQIEEVNDLLNLPEYVYPVCGLSIGKPIVEMRVKPRLPQEAIVHFDTYKPCNKELLNEYDKTMIKFGEKRETKTWTKKFADYFSQKPSENLNRYLRKQKIIK